MTANLKSGSVMTFVHILMYVFNRLDGGADLNVDMTVIFCNEVGIVWYNVTVVQWSIVDQVDPPILASPVKRITILVHLCLWLPMSRVALLTLSFLKTWRLVGDTCAARTMNHVLRDLVEEIRAVSSDWKLCTDDGVNILDSLNL